MAGEGLDPYETFMPALLSCIAVTEGPILEVGMGHFSTPMLHAICQRRALCSVESNQKWLDRFNLGSSVSGIHELICDSSYGILKTLATRQWSVVFIDHSPGNRRGLDCALFRHSAEYVVVHDYAEDTARSVDAVKHLFPYAVVCDKYQPYTIVLGNKPIPPLDFWFVPGPM